VEKVIAATNLEAMEKANSVGIAAPVTKRTREVVIESSEESSRINLPREPLPFIACGAALDYGYNVSDGGAIAKIGFPYTWAIAALVST
jgi:hypothetical protein